MSERNHALIPLVVVATRSFRQVAPEQHLAGDAITLRLGRAYRRHSGPPVARLSPATASEIGAADGNLVRVSTSHGSITAPLVITEMADRVARLPLNSPGAPVHEALRVGAGAVVSIEGARNEGAR
jgi:anaerobic selenocysteine-containing dehydrogenase